MYRDHESYGLTKAQKRIWFDYQANPESVTNIALVYQLDGDVERERLQQALNYLIHNHQAFRTRVRASLQRVSCVIQDNFNWNLEYHDLSQAQDEGESFRRINSIVETKLNLTHGNLFHFALIKKSSQRFYLILLIHPFILDRSCIKRFVAELARYYNQGIPAERHEDLSVAAVIDYEHEYTRSRQYQEGIAHWLNTVKAHSFQFEIPQQGFYPEAEVDMPRIAVQLDTSTTSALHALLDAHNLSMRAVVMSAFSLLMQRYTNQRDIILYHTMPAYQQHKFDHILACIENCLPLRLKYDQSQDFVSLVAQTEAQLQYDDYYSGCQLNDIVKAVRNKIDSSFSGSFTNIAVEENYLPYGELQLDTIKTKLITDYARNNLRDDLILYYTEYRGALNCIFEFKPDYDRVFVMKLAQHFTTLLTNLIRHPQRALRAVPMLDDEDRQQLLQDFTQGPISTNLPENVKVAFENIVVNFPNNAAVDCRGEVLTYAQLNERANQWAYYLLSQLSDNVAEPIIAVYMPRSLDLIVAMLAIVKLGGSYLILDPKYPEARLSYFIEDAEPGLVITLSQWRTHLSALQTFANPIVLFDKVADKVGTQPVANIKNCIDSDALINIIYTSGSTGKPKGVPVPHRGVTRLVCQPSYITITAHDRIAQAASLSFDAATFEIWGALLNGATLVCLPSDEVLPAEDFARFLQAHEITILWLTVALFNQYAIENPAMFKSLGYLLTGGDALNPETIARVINCRDGAPQYVLNGYGPTENTTFTTTYAIPTDFDSGERLPIGKPINNTTCYVLDDDLNPMPVGTYGELYTGGDGVSLGYLYREDLTKERFVNNPFHNNHANPILYRTGDMVRWGADGNIEFASRKDSQLKIRGFRVELGEIEAELVNIDGIAHSAVLALDHEQLGKTLVAYYVLAGDAEVDQTQIRSLLRQRLPEYMVPTHLVELSDLPITANGKLDKQRLPNPLQQNDETNAQSGKRYEKFITELWQLLFGLNDAKFNPDDDFFELGGHSLMATQFVSRVRRQLKVDLHVKDVFKLRTIRKLAQHIESLVASDKVAQFPFLVHREKTGAPLSASQQRLWYLSQLSDQAGAYNIPFAIEFQGKQLALNLLGQALSLIVADESFRTVFYMENGEPKQKILPAKKVELSVVRLRCDDELSQFMITRGNQPFDLSQGYLYDFVWLEVKDKAYLYFNVHHIIFDGWSLKLFMQRLYHYYKALQQGDKPEIITQPLGYIDYSVSQQQWISKNLLATELDYWYHKLGGELPQLKLPEIKQSREDGNATCARKELVINSERAQQLIKLAHKCKVSLYSLCLSLFSVLLQRYSQQYELIIGSPIANRNHTEVEDVIGFFVNTLPYRIELRDDERFIDLLQAIHQQSLDVAENQDVPLNMIIEKLGLANQTDSQPLFQVLFSLQNGFALEDHWDDLHITYSVHEFPNKHAKFKLMLILNEMQDGSLAGFFEYHNALFEPWLIEQMSRHYLNLVDAVLAKFDASLLDISLLSYQDRNLLLNDWSKGKQVAYGRRCLHHFLESSALRYPDRHAVIFQNKTLTYAELNKRANQLAHYLRQYYLALHHQPLAINTLIGVSLPRDERMIVVLLAVLKAGAAYVPLDPAYPESRINYIAEDIAAPIIITTSDLKNVFTQTLQDKLLLLDEIDLQVYDHCNLDLAIKPHHYAHVIYTSGSTGKPKGVIVPHQGLANTSLSLMDEWCIDNTTRVLQYASLNFDSSTWEIYATLAAAATMIIAPTSVRQSYLELIDFMRNERIQVAFLTPALVQVLPQVKLPDLRVLAIGGDTCREETLRYWAEQCQVYNGYGPTETSVFATWSHYQIGDLAQQIGRPIPNTTCYILDKNLQPLPVGVIGELYIGGVGLAAKYLNQTALTIERFIINPFADDPSDKLYRSGDLVRWLPTSQIEFIGRSDFQVKVRGFRIELKEIEQIIKAHPDVVEAYVMVRDGAADKEIVAYYQVASEKNLSMQRLRDYLVAELPNYMVPHHLLEVEAFVTNLSGKVDKNALPAPESLLQENRDTVLPQNAREAKLLTIWQEVLANKNFGVTDNFFRLGGHSLLVVKLVYMINRAFNSHIDIKTIFNYPTIAALAEQIDEDAQLGSQTEIKAYHQNQYPLASQQLRLWFLDTFVGGNSNEYNIPLAVRLQGQFNLEKFSSALQQLLARHAVLRSKIAVDAEHNPIQIILPSLNLQLQPEVISEQQLAPAMREEALKPFSLENDVLARWRLWQLADNDFVFMFNLHHIISDGWSSDVLWQDLMAFYQNKLLAPLAIQYGDYCVWQQQQAQNQNDLAFWKNYLKDFVPTELPADYARPAVKSTHGEHVSILLDKNIVTEAQRIAAALGVTPNVLAFGLFSYLLAKYTGQNDLTVGMPLANRPLPQLENLIGYFVNTVPVRTRLNYQLSLREYLLELKQDMLQPLQHADVALDQIVDHLKLTRDTSRTPVFQILFAYQTASLHIADLANVKASLLEVDYPIAKFDFALALYPETNGLKITAEYNTDLFKRDTIDNFLKLYSSLFTRLTAFIDQPLQQLSLLDAAEIKALMTLGSGTEEPRPATTLHQLVSQAAKEYPDQTALIFQAQTVSYAELENTTNQLARAIQAYFADQGHSPITANTLIGVCLPRGCDMIIATLAILKAGAAYVPLDPSYPQERLDYIVSDTNVPLIITQPDLINHFSDAKRCVALEQLHGSLFSADPLDLSYQAKDWAHVIYTSGSTGKPKGVLVPHAGLVNTALAMIDAFQVTPQSRVLQFASLNFDAATSEIYMALASGATLVIADQEARQSYLSLFDLLKNQRINVATIPPAVLQLFPQQTLPDLTALIVAGDVCAEHVMRFWSQGRRLINAYGPTEASICATFSVYQLGDSPQQIGRALANTQVAVFDDNQQLVPMGVTGELYLGGAGIADGYWQRADLTQERFIDHPLFPNTKLYRTGDLVRWLSNHQLEFIGRVDFQVKFNGYRIELGEIESALLNLDEIDEACVIVRKVGDNQQLVAYMTAHLQLNIDDLKRRLKMLLPEYMLPTLYMQLATMPLSPNGKIDRKALPEPSLQQQIEYVAPQTELEKNLAELWCRLLGFEKISMTANFFQSGGNSLLSAKMLAEVRELTQRDFALAQFFADPTLGGLINLLEHNGAATQTDPLAAARHDATQDLLANLQLPEITREYKNILLTGASGFLGSHLLQALLEQTDADIYCLIRSANPLQVSEKLTAALQKYRMPYLQNNARIHVLCGDLSKAHLGLTESEYAMLAQNMDAIYHNAAWINHVYDYQTLKATNVHSALELIKLATTHKTKYFHFISTQSAHDQSAELAPTAEPVSNNGYVLCKWVSEQLLWHAAQHGLPVSIYRPGNITGHSQTGLCDAEHNHALLLLKGCIQMGAAPDWHMPLEMTPVDILSQGIVRLSLQMETTPHAYNLANPHQLQWRPYIEQVQQAGYAVKLIDLPAWQHDYLANIDEHNVLYPLRALYQHISDEDASEVDAPSVTAMPAIANYPECYQPLVATYLKYLQEIKFI